MRCILSCQDTGWQIKPVGMSALRPWLQERDSLTARLKRQYPDFAVQVLRQAWRKPNMDETSLLKVAPASRVWAREVLLMGGGQPRVFAHSVIARTDLRGPWCGLRKMGRAPLGGALFADPLIQRGALHYRKLPARHPLRKNLPAGLSVSRHRQLWARRSMFYLQRYRLLITEVFLPANTPRERGWF